MSLPGEYIRAIFNVESTTELMDRIITTNLKNMLIDIRGTGLSRRNKPHLMNLCRLWLKYKKVAYQDSKLMLVSVRSADELGGITNIKFSCKAPYSCYELTQSTTPGDKIEILVDHKRKLCEGVVGGDDVRECFVVLVQHNDVECARNRLVGIGGWKFIEHSEDLMIMD